MYWGQSGEFVYWFGHWGLLNIPSWSFLLSIYQHIFDSDHLVICNHIISLRNIPSLTVSCSGPWTVLSLITIFWFDCAFDIWVVQDLTDCNTADFVSNCTVPPPLSIVTIHHAYSKVTWKVGSFTKERCLYEEKNILRYRCWLFTIYMGKLVSSWFK